MRTIREHTMTLVLETDDANVSIVVGEDAIREAGWMRTEDEEVCDEAHCHDDSCQCVLAEVAIEAVRRWHNESDHAYAFKFCDQRPCSDMWGYSDLALVR